MCSSKKYPYPLPHGGHCCFRPPPPGVCVIFQLGLVPPGKNISLKNAVALFFYAKDNCFCDKERTNIFIYVNLFDFLKTNLTKFAVIWVKGVTVTKEKESRKERARRRKRGEEKKTMAVLLAFIIAIKNPASNTQCQTISILPCRGLYSPRNDPQPWNDPQIDHFYSTKSYFRWLSPFPFRIIEIYRPPHAHYKAKP